MPLAVSKSRIEGSPNFSHSSRFLFVSRFVEVPLNEIPPDIRYLIPCWKEPTIIGQRPSANEILYSVQPKAGLQYPVWQRTFFVLVMIANLHGKCKFHLETRLEEMEAESVIQRTNDLIVESGNDPLRVQPISIMMKPVELPKSGIYQVCFVWKKEVLAKAQIHAR
jgi:hypothetical protein